MKKSSKMIKIVLLSSTVMIRFCESSFIFPRSMQTWPKKWQASCSYASLALEGDLGAHHAKHRRLIWQRDHRELSSARLKSPTVYQIGPQRRWTYQKDSFHRQQDTVCFFILNWSKSDLWKENRENEGRWIPIKTNWKGLTSSIRHILPRAPKYNATLDKVFSGMRRSQNLVFFCENQVFYMSYHW